MSPRTVVNVVRVIPRFDVEDRQTRPTDVGGLGHDDSTLNSYPYNSRPFCRIIMALTRNMSDSVEYSTKSTRNRLTQKGCRYIPLTRIGVKCLRL